MVKGLVHDRREGLLFGRWLFRIDEAWQGACRDEAFGGGALGIKEVGHIGCRKRELIQSGMWGGGKEKGL